MKQITWKDESGEEMELDWDAVFTWIGGILIVAGILLIVWAGKNAGAW